MNRAVQGITISIGGRCQGGWTESGGMQEQPRMSPLLFLSSFPFSFLFLTFWPFQQCWAFRGAPEEQVHSDCTRQRMGPPVLLPYFVLSCHAGTQPLSDFAAGEKRVGGACAAGDTWSPIAGGLGRGIPWSGFLGLQISLVCVWCCCFSLKTRCLPWAMPQFNYGRSDFPCGVECNESDEKLALWPLCF